MPETSKPLSRYTRREVANHNNSKSCWIIIDNIIYDVTKWMEEHPGGIEVLLEQGGKDGTQAYEDVGHSADAIEMRTDYCIGELVEADKKEFKPSSMWVKPNAELESKSNTLNVIMATVIGLGAFMIYRWISAAA